MPAEQVGQVAVQPWASPAALVANLDVVVDTAVIHLAGALGVPAWVALPSAPDWH